MSTKIVKKGTMIGRWLIVVSLLAAMLALAGCGQKKIDEKIAIGALNGPTGMGLVDLTDDEMIDLQTYQAPDEAVQKLLSGELEVACLPSNMGAVLYAKTDGQVQVLTTIVNGVLYLVENGESIGELKELKGRTIIASGKGGTPEYVLETLLAAGGLELGKDVQVEWMDAHADVATKLATTEGAIALLPEPFLTSVCAKSDAVKVAVDINEAWYKLTGEELPMGILVASKEFAGDADCVEYLLEAVATSIEDVNTASDEVAERIVAAGFLADAGLCKAVIPNCSLTCMSSEESKAALSVFYQKLFEADPSSVGGALPDENLYY